MIPQKQKSLYQPLDAEVLVSDCSVNDEDELRRSPLLDFLWHNSIYIITSTLIVVAVIILIFLPGNKPLSSEVEKGNHNQFNTCGNSSSEALSLGCSFNQLMWSWYPKECPLYANDAYLSAEPENPWTFYVDPYKRQVASSDDWEKMLNNEIGLFSEKREHATHCVFMYVALVQIFRGGGRYTANQVDEEHLHHCSEMMLGMLRKDGTWFDVDAATPLVSYHETW